MIGHQIKRLYGQIDLVYIRDRVYHVEIRYVLSACMW